MSSKKKLQPKDKKTTAWWQRRNLRREDKQKAYAKQGEEKHEVSDVS
jgi:hypothetical protein